MVDIMSQEDIAGMVNPSRVNPWDYTEDGSHFITRKDSNHRVAFITFGIALQSNVMRAEVWGPGI